MNMLLAREWAHQRIQNMANYHPEKILPSPPLSTTLLKFTLCLALTLGIHSLSIAQRGC